ncbi:major capsid protein [Sphingobacterium deserti]|uniref:Major capsid protein E n=1 Tax=Sphingobacterium deserti TaxID=1229276 RepID=A0A0B8T7U3_9SPHI|nr:major capsid protein [Sphingobacterium deserti]KGE14624.1 hypothetical protein DI53_1653 [Sphingobacterium deserti]
MEYQKSKLLAFLAAEGLTPDVILEANNTRFAPTWYQRYFRTEAPSVSLDFTTVIGEDGIESLASVISRESEFTLRARKGIEKLKGEVPAIGVRRKLNAQELRNIELLLTSPSVSGSQRLTSIITSMIDDYLYTRNSVARRVDSMVKQGLSTGRVTIDTTNNPDGIVFDVPVIKDTNITPASGDWANPDHDIIADINRETQAAEDATDAQPISKILITRSLWRKISTNKSVQNYVKAYIGNSGAKYVPTLVNVNSALEENLLPTFEIVDDKAAVETDGVQSSFSSWNADNAIFIPGGELGVIHNALADEQLNPVNGIEYIVSDNILLSRWRERKPLAEITEAEWNAFPGFKAAKSIRIIKTKGE